MCGPRPAAYAEAMTETSVTCDLCATRPGAPQAPITWSVTMDRGKVIRFCESCTRGHLWAMEGKLDREHW